MEEELQRASVMPRDLTFTFLEHITNKFSKDRIIGHGGYGVVYKGVLDNGEQIAIKKLYPKHPELDDDKQFKNECINLMRVQHQNVVRLVGYCHEISHKVWPYEGKYVFAEVEERALCFEFLQGGSLDKHLSDESSKLGWRTCYKIIKGISEGLLYLHHGSKDPIYHLDLKPANILLDKNMMAKIGDFGLSRLADSTQTCTTTEIRGTLGYMPPEYIDRYQITPKFDVFSLGVIIIQIMAGREGYSRCGDMSSQEFIDLVHDNWLKTQQATMSLHIAHEVKTCIEIALRCVEADRAKRPTITEIVDELNKIDTGKRSLIDQVTNSQSKQEFNQYASSGAADAESASTALRNPRVKYGDEGTSMGMKEKERSFPVLDPRIPTMPSLSRPSSSSDSNIEAGSGSGSAGDECKRKRMLSNREAARRSRARKQQRMEELIAEASRLQAENARVEAQIGAYSAELGKVDAENSVLHSRHSWLAGRLQALGGVLEIFQVAGAPVNIPEIPDPMLRPWQSPFAP